MPDRDKMLKDLEEYARGQSREHNILALKYPDDSQYNLMERSYAVAMNDIACWTFEVRRTQ